MAKYAWAQGYVYKCNAQVAGEMCEELRSQGALTAESLLAANVAEDAPLHKAFEWDDAKAAHGYRVNQARGIIGHLQIIRESDDKPVKRYYSIVRDDPHYEAVEVIMNNEEMRERLLRNSRKDFETFSQKYQDLQEWAEVIELGSQV